MVTEKSSVIAAQNDAFRKQVPYAVYLAGTTVMTAAVASLDAIALGELLTSIRAYNNFDNGVANKESSNIDKDGIYDGNDPYGEHDFGKIGNYFFKFDYYDSSEMEYGSEDPSDPTKTYRVLTIGEMSDY